MGNRSYLYLRAGVGAQASAFQIAEANNNFPTLWQLLLAGGRPGDAITHQRVFGDAGTLGIEADAAVAADRCAAMAALFSTHPLRALHPDVAVDMQRIAAALSAKVAELALAHGAPVVLSADLDQLSWLGDASPAAFIRQSICDCNDRWLLAESALHAGLHAQFDMACDIRRFDDESAWEYGFGLSLMRLDDERAADEPAEAEEPEDIDDAADDPPLPGGLHRWRDDAGRVGVRRRNGRVVVAAAWDAVDTADAARALFWVWRDGRAGLLRADGRGEQLLLAPQFSDAWPFEHGVAGVIPHGGEQIGLIGPDGGWLMQPCIDELWDVVHQAALARVGEQFGFVGTAGDWLIAPQLLAAEEFNEAGLAPARTADGWGLLRRDGHWAVAPAWDELQWEPTAHGQGSGLVQVVRGDHIGVLDAAGRVLIPCEYGGVACVEPVAEAAQASAQAPLRWVCVMRRDGEAMRVGAFDLAGGCERIPCRFDALERFGWGTACGWLVAEPGTHRVGVLREDGEVLHPPVYAWIYAERESPPAFGSLHRALVGHAWARGEGVRAQRADENTTVWLCADGRVLSPADYAEARLAAGDLRAVLTHAECLRDGAGVPVDEAAARRWFGLAAGLPPGADLADPSRAAPHGLSSAMHDLAVMLRDGSGGAADPTAARAWLALAIERARKGDTDAVAHALLGHLLAEGLGGPADVGAARRHYALSAAQGNGMALYNLGLLHLMGEGGPVDLPAAAQCFREAWAQQRDGAGYQLGRVLTMQAAAAAATDAATATATAAALRREARYFLTPSAAEAGDALRPHACLLLGQLALADGDRPGARTWLTDAAEGVDPGDDVDGVRATAAALLAGEVYGDAGSPLHDPVQAAHWRQAARPASPPDLGDVVRAGGALIKGLLRRLRGG